MTTANNVVEAVPPSGSAPVEFYVDDDGHVSIHVPCHGGHAVILGRIDPATRWRDLADARKYLPSSTPADPGRHITLNVSDGRGRVWRLCNPPWLHFPPRMGEYVAFELSDGELLHVPVERVIHDAAGLTDTGGLLVLLGRVEMPSIMHEADELARLGFEVLE